MKKESAQRDNKTLKTVIIYGLLVFALVVVSLTVKVIALIQESKFEGNEQVVIAVVESGAVTKLIGFDPLLNKTAVMEVSGEKISPYTLGRTLGVVPDGTIILPDGFSSRQQDVSAFFMQSLVRFADVESEFTPIDMAKIAWISRGIGRSNQKEEEIELPLETKFIDSSISNLFVDEHIAHENVSIQIINASEIAGMGRRLERILLNKGANVVAVSTSLKPTENSIIKSFGEESYTLQKLHNLFGFPLEKVEEQPIANIVIVIGKDQKNVGRF